MTRERLQDILTQHRLWLNNESGERANLSGADLRGADLRGANLRGANLSDADLRGANLRGANLSGTNLFRANLSGTNLRYADLRDANLSGADLFRADLCRANLFRANLSGTNLSDADLFRANLRGADLRDANLSGADLRGADLLSANLRDANLSDAKGLISAADYLARTFERTEEGYVAYKTFNATYRAPGDWVIAPGQVISENVNSNRCQSCGCGINVAPLLWVRDNYNTDTHQVWKVLIRWEWLAGVCVPYMTDGKVRCERVELLEVVE